MVHSPTKHRDSPRKHRGKTKEINALLQEHVETVDMLRIFEELEAATTAIKCRESRYKAEKLNSEDKKKSLNQSFTVVEGQKEELQAEAIRISSSDAENRADNEVAAALAMRKEVIAWSSFTTQQHNHALKVRPCS
jgi:peptide subunit release factor 1 (eRF1)